MRVMMALVLHLGGVGECVSLIWEWSDHGQESGDLQPASNNQTRTWWWLVMIIVQLAAPGGTIGKKMRI